jgi:hypothetical protein
MNKIIFHTFFFKKIIQFLILVPAENDPSFKCTFSQFVSHIVCLFRLSLGKNPNAFFVYAKSFYAAYETVSL